MAWGKEWIAQDAAKEDWARHNAQWDLANGSKIIFKGNEEPIKSLASFEWNGDLANPPRNFKTQGSNLVDNNSYLYFQCNECLDIFDPHTKSFATLNQRRHEAGWKVKWNLDGMGYKVYCVKCGEDG